MSSGLLGKASLAANTDTTVYTVPAGRVTTANINIVNRTNVAILVRLAISTTATPTETDWIEFDVSVPANGVLERTGIVMQAEELIVARATATGITIRAHGFEEIA